MCMCEEEIVYICDMMWKTCTTLSNTQLEDLCAEIGCKQSKTNSCPIKQGCGYPTHFLSS